MTNGVEIDKASRIALAHRYAQGEMTIHELRSAGHGSVIELFADLAEIGRRPPIAAMIGPNVQTRSAGLARLRSRLRP